MTQTTAMDQALVEAYLEAEYRVHAEPPITLRIGLPSHALRKLHQLHGGNSAFITAFNPFSQELSEEESLARQELLKADLLAAGCFVLPGIGRRFLNEMSREPSFLAVGIAAEAAKAIGTKYEQNAIVYNQAIAVPELVLLR
ncbi:MAG: DUF3293 domain-containing protein [Rhodocyclaceae bacterium]|nr:DUF3293 domain-containing protein [Rhodocyclaceae bacterium]MCA3021455.1 DUF3293 domain-containing protein [Rhodocyclaceae bacterium]MCA3028405.1 DUF3293 domain-containing protein [Rhodocyclaceae bacterium]MCA3044008.1 DUF3293 domain-containing protein [Rhodocyclaceae bacterium]MCA3054203.1 DUF3293 domain-containing protein [Rhodocyclaceae bacterium]